MRVSILPVTYAALAILYLSDSAIPLTSRFTISPVWVPLSCSTAPFWLVSTIVWGPRADAEPFVPHHQAAHFPSIFSPSLPPMLMERPGFWRS